VNASSTPSEVTMDAPAPISGSPAAMKPPNTNSITTSAMGSATVSPRRRSFSLMDIRESVSSCVLPTSTVAPGCSARRSRAAASIRRRASSTVCWDACLPSTPATVAVMRMPLPSFATSGATCGFRMPSGTASGSATDVPGSPASSRASVLVPATREGSCGSPPWISSVMLVPEPVERRSEPAALSPCTLGTDPPSRSKRVCPPMPPSAVAAAATTTSSQHDSAIHGRRAAAAPSLPTGPVFGAVDARVTCALSP
jgi:hypothetical protein